MMDRTNLCCAAVVAGALTILIPQTVPASEDCEGLACAGERLVLVAPHADRKVVRRLRREGFEQVHVGTDPDLDVTDLDPQAVAPLLIGKRDLDDPEIVDLIHALYERGDAIGITFPSRGAAKRLISLLEAVSDVWPDDEGPRAEFFAIRLVHDDDGRRHPSTYVSLLPEGISANTPMHMGLGDDGVERYVLDWLTERLGSTPPVLAAAAGDDQDNNLANIASSTHTSVQKVGPDLSVIQLDAFAITARSFQNSEDIFYYNVELQLRNQCEDTTREASNDGGLGSPSIANTVFSTSPQSTRETKQITSGVSETFGGSIGFSSGEGLGFDVSASATLSQSTTTTVVPTVVTNMTELAFQLPAWSYDISEFSTGSDITFNTKWFWTIPFSLYEQNDFVPRTVDALLGATLSSGCQAFSIVQWRSPVAVPFGSVLKLEPPMISQITPATVNEGGVFTIEGTSLYPSFIESVTIGGVEVPDGLLVPRSDTELEVIAPSNVPSFNEPLIVLVKTGEGLSNVGKTVTITK